MNTSSSLIGTGNPSPEMYNVQPRGCDATGFDGAIAAAHVHRSSLHREARPKEKKRKEEGYDRYDVGPPAA